MAYLAFDEAGLARLPESTGLIARAAPIAGPARTAAAGRLTGLEWSVVALARFDRLSSLRPAGRLATALAALFGRAINPRLADDRLEALRRMAVLGWHHGDGVPADELNAFLRAGFTPAHYEAMQTRIGAERLTRNDRG